jgi:hypothetical protein
MSPKWLSDILNPPSSIPVKARVEIFADRAQYSLGEQIKGKIKITSEEEFLANQVTVCLTCNESIKKNRVTANQYGTFQSEYWDNAAIYRSSCKIFGAATIPQGFSASYTYTLDISLGARETLYSLDHNVKWMLFAIMESNGRPNVLTQSYEVQVSRPMVNQNSPTVMKEVT